MTHVEEGGGGEKPFQGTRVPIFAPEEVTACITGEKWILRGHVDNSLTFGEDTCCQKKKCSQRILAAARGWGYLC